MRVYRAVVNRGDVLHYVIKGGVFFFSEADLEAKHTLYGRAPVKSTIIPLGDKMRFISMGRANEKYPNQLHLTSYRDFETVCLASNVKGGHNDFVISFEVDEKLIEIVE